MCGGAGAAGDGGDCRRCGEGGCLAEEGVVERMIGADPWRFVCVRACLRMCGRWVGLFFLLGWAGIAVGWVELGWAGWEC